MPETTLSSGNIGGLAIKKPGITLPNLNMLLYGESGVGKTLLAGSACFVEEMSPVLFIDVEDGTLTLNHFGADAKIDIVRLVRYADMQKIYDQLYDGKLPYRTVVLDSLSESQKAAMNLVNGNPQGNNLNSIGNLPEFKEWNTNTDQMRRLIRAFRDLPINTIFTALATDLQENPNRESSPYVRLPALTKKLAWEVPALFDMVFYMSVKGEPPKRTIQTQKNDKVVAKSRVPGLPPYIDSGQMNMEALYDMLIRNPRPMTAEEQAQVAQARSGMAKKK